MKNLEDLSLRFARRTSWQPFIGVCAPVIDRLRGSAAQMDVDDARAEEDEPPGPSRRPHAEPQHSDDRSRSATELLAPPRLPQPLPSDVSWGLLAVPHKLKFADMEYLEVLGVCAAHVWATPWLMHNLVKSIKEALLKKEASLRLEATREREHDAVAAGSPASRQPPRAKRKAAGSAT